MHKTLTALLIMLALAGCGRRQAEAPVEAAASAPAASPLGGAPVAFAICLSCHAVKPGVTVIGPSLHGVYGTRAGAVPPDYAFSAALKKSGLVWTDATLDRWLTSPVTTVPGTYMGYAGQPDRAKRAQIIAYLKTLH